MNSTEPVLLIFTKKPIPGQVKTRFFPDVSPQNAAIVAHEMIRITVKTAVQSWPGPVTLLVSPDASHLSLKKLAQQYNIELSNQSTGNLGMKMETAICATLKRRPAAIIGCDIPSISISILRYAYARMLAGNNVIGPTTDGGFYFIGLHQALAGMFNDIPWGTNQVFRLVLKQLLDCGIRMDVILSCLQDIDTWDDFLWATKFDANLKKILCKINP